MESGTGVRRVVGVTRAPLLAAALLLLAGCVETEERWTIGSQGDGEWSLTVRWNADLWRRAEGLVGPEPLRRISGRGFPLRAAEWRDLFDGLEGTTLLEAEERDLEGGVRELRIRASFRTVADLLPCEFLEGRRVRIAREGDERVVFEMEPRGEFPVLDPLASLAGALARSPPGAPGAPPEPSPLETLGIDPAQADLLVPLFADALRKVRISLRVEVPGLLLEGGDPAARRGKEASFDLGFEDLKSPLDRAWRLAWQPLSFDRPPEVDRP
jgi:hypothetical protein